MSEVLYKFKPAGMPMPFVKMVVRRGYRIDSRFADLKPDSATATAATPTPSEDTVHSPSHTPTTSTTAAATTSGDSTITHDITTDDNGSEPGHAKAPEEKKTKKEKRKDLTGWLGYAFVVFRDKEEASEAMAHYNSLDAGCGWVLRVKQAESRRGTKVKETPPTR